MIAQLWGLPRDLPRTLRANRTPLKPFRVDMGPVLERIPIELETMAQWAKRQDWRMTNKPRPPAG